MCPVAVKILVGHASNVVVMVIHGKDLADNALQLIG